MTTMFCCWQMRFFLCLFSYLSVCHAQQQQHVLKASLASSNSDDIKLNFSSSAPHIFSSLHGVLQQWPNTFFPNGHSIVPCEIPPYTLLYHGRPSDDLPPSPEFLAFDIEMAYAIMGSTRNSHMLTYQATRPVRCLYFDGQSAALMGSGPMDSQMVFLYGNTTGPSSGGHFLGAEYARARGLCEWALSNDMGGPGWGIEGIVRMNAGFEMMWCNFASPSLRLIDHLNVSAPLLPKKRTALAFAEEADSDSQSVTPPVFPMPTTTASDASPTASEPPTFSLPPDWQDMQLREPFVFAGNREWFRSTSWHYGTTGSGPGKGETRIKALVCGLLSYYDPLFTSRAAATSSIEESYLNLTIDGLWHGPSENGTREVGLQQLARRRMYHNLQGVNTVDATLMNEHAKQALTNLNSSSPVCTGLDWVALADEIVNRYSKPLVELSHFLSSFDHTTAENNTETEKFILSARIRCHAFLLPLLDYPDPSEDPDETWQLSSPLGQETLSRCTYHYTRLLHPLPATTTAPETTLLTSIEEVLSAICRTIITVGFSVELAYLTHITSSPTTTTMPTSQPLTDLSAQTSHSADLLNTLLAYLGWLPSLTSCTLPCAWDEVCHIPIWPLDMFAAVPSPSENSTAPPPPPGPPGQPHRGPPGHGDGGFPPPGHGHRGNGTGRWGPGPGHGGPPPGWDRGGNRSVGHGGMDNLPPHIGGRGMGFGSRDVQDARCVKVHDMHRFPL